MNTKRFLMILLLISIMILKAMIFQMGIEELIEELNEGLAVGLPYHNMPMATKETGGQYLGSITLVGGLK